MCWWSRLFGGGCFTTRWPCGGVRGAVWPGVAVHPQRGGPSPSGTPRGLWSSRTHSPGRARPCLASRALPSSSEQPPPPAVGPPSVVSPSVAPFLSSLPRKAVGLGVTGGPGGRLGRGARSWEPEVLGEPRLRDRRGRALGSRSGGAPGGWLNQVCAGSRSGVVLTLAGNQALPWGPGKRSSSSLSPLLHKRRGCYFLLCLLKKETLFIYF